MRPTIFSIAPQTAEDTDMLPPGMLAHFGGPDAPSGWLVCDGTDYLSSDYPALSAYLAGTWDSFRATSPGAGRFRVPKANGLVLMATGGAVGTGVVTTARSLADLVGAERHTLTEDEMPSHIHPLGSGGNTGVQSDGTTAPAGTNTEAPVPSVTATLAATEATGGNQTHNNMQPSFAALLCIKT